MISQMTPAGVSPARRARSTEPSVCPVRTSTPPRARAEREDVAGRDEIVGLARRGSRRRAIVCARSAALMPVVTPCRASMLTVNAVPSGGPRAPGRRHHRQARGARSAPRSSVRQMRPRPCVAMKLMASGVTNCAAMREVALVLAVLVVDEDDHLAGADVGDGAVDALEELRVRCSGRGACACSSTGIRRAARRSSPARRRSRLPSRAPEPRGGARRSARGGRPRGSRARRPASASSEVLSRVCGTSMTSKRSSSTSLTVRLTPLTQIEPFCAMKRASSRGHLEDDLHGAADRASCRRPCPTPSTWPLTMCPPRRPPSGTRALEVDVARRARASPSVVLRERLGRGVGLEAAAGDRVRP